jgi:hypothetical protein
MLWIPYCEAVAGLSSVFNLAIVDDNVPLKRRRNKRAVSRVYKNPGQERQRASISGCYETTRPWQVEMIRK